MAAARPASLILVLLELIPTTNRCSLTKLWVPFRETLSRPGDLLSYGFRVLALCFAQHDFHLVLYLVAQSPECDTAPSAANAVYLDWAITSSIVGCSASQSEPNDE